MDNKKPSPCPFCKCDAEIINGKVYCRGPNDCASASPDDWDRVAGSEAKLAVAVELLESVRKWDMLNPGPVLSEPLADGPWLRNLIDEALIKLR